MADVEVNDFLEHYGIPGMKWGKRNASGDAGGGSNRSNLRSLDKQTRQKDRDAHASEVDAARARFKSGDAKREYKDAKATYKEQRNIVGKAEARKAFDKVKERNFADAQKSNEYRDGKELGTAIALSVVGAVLMSSVLSR